jgi:hypothetical protein
MGLEIILMLKLMRKLKKNSYGIYLKNILQLQNK